MTAREFQPGDVAMVTWDDASSAARCRGQHDVKTEIALRTSTGWALSAALNHLTEPSTIIDARPLPVVDYDSPEHVGRLADELVRFGIGNGVAHSTLAAALREFADPKPRCVAHGEAACPECSRIRTVDFSGGECLHCSVYGTDGMHWDTCPGRIRGPVFASRDEAMEARP